MSQLTASASPRKKWLVPAWISFDFGNSAFAVIMVTLVLPLYFGKTIVTDGRGDFYWGIAMSASMLLVALLGPILGAIADSTSSKKQFLMAFSAVTILCTAALAFVSPGMIAVAMALFILANAGFEGGIIFYNSFLPNITDEDHYGRISGYGFAAGYLGGFVIILGLLPLLLNDKIPLAFVITAAFFLLFALPLFFVFPNRSKGSRLSNPIKTGITNTIDTIRQLKNYRDVARFLLAFFVYNDAILTVIGFAALYSQTSLKFTTEQTVILILMIQLVAGLGSLFFAKITDKKGPKFVINITLLMWCVVCVMAYYVSSADVFYVVGALAALALGSSQSASRTLMAKLTPPDKTAQFFGFYDGFCGKASAVIGPFVFGLMSDTFGQREAVLSLIVFFGAGLLLMRRVKEPGLEREKAQIHAIA
jgi:MFS transporter, UMF1 family